VCGTVDLADVHVDGADAGFIVGLFNNGQSATQMLKGQRVRPCKMVDDAKFLKTV